MQVLNRGWKNSPALAVNVIDPNVVRLSKKSKYGSLKEAIEAAKAKPGSVTVGADSPSSGDHMAMYALSKATGAKFTFVSFSGSSPANRLFMAGEVDIAIGNAFDHVKSKDSAKESTILRPERYALLPNIPLLKKHWALTWAILVQRVALQQQVAHRKTCSKFTAKRLVWLLPMRNIWRRHASVTLRL